MNTNSQQKASSKPQTLAWLDELLGTIEDAPPLAKGRYQGAIVSAAGDLLDNEQGLRDLYDRAPRFDKVGLFHAGPWENPADLRPSLVSHGLRAEGAVSTIEALSELRMLSLAMGFHEHPEVKAEEAKEFLLQATARNLDLLLGTDSEDRQRRPKIFKRAQRVLRLIQDEVALEGLEKVILEEVRVLSAQRPIVTDRLQSLVHSALELAETLDTHTLGDGLSKYRRAMDDATDLSRSARNPGEYRRSLRDATLEQLQSESQAMAGLMHETGICNPCHSALLRYLCESHGELLGSALGLNQLGLAELDQNEEAVRSLIRVAIFPETAPAIYGLARTIERGLLSRPAVAQGLRRLTDMDIAAEPRRELLAGFSDDSAVTANAALLAGTLGVLGQPLGIGQGSSPTCQSARGMSLWSLHAPNLLLDMVVSAARNEIVEMEFEGARVASNELPPSEYESRFDSGVDAVSKVLVRHLDRIYQEMSRRAAGRGEDTHKWVNPAMYGRWVARGFASPIDPLTGRVSFYRGFVRRFFATHHPEFHGGHDLVYPNPVGLLVTDVSGRLIGPHAVSLQRVAQDEKGELRAYFFNPNNDGRQDWGQGIRPSVSGNGEIPGESSLPFEDFASRLYAFHYNPYEEGDAFAVPDESVEAVVVKARESWGRSYPWAE